MGSQNALKLANTVWNSKLAKFYSLIEVWINNGFAT